MLVLIWGMGHKLLACVGVGLQLQLHLKGCRSHTRMGRHGPKTAPCELRTAGLECDVFEKLAPVVMATTKTIRVTCLALERENPLTNYFRNGADTPSE